MPQSIMFVHAHPDDESVGTGATMAHYVAAGARVTLVTCTLGEEGEIHVPDLARLAADQADQLGGYRIGELTRACAALGVTDHRFLGGAGRYRDSGMMGTPANDHPRAFWQADLDEAAGLLVEVIHEVRPQVLVTYDPNGFYGHPDHIQAHRVAMRAAELAGAAAPSKIYWTAVPRSALIKGFAEFADSADNPFEGIDNPDDLPFGTPDEQITAAIDGRVQAQRKLAALRAYATQIPPNSWLLRIASSFAERAGGPEIDPRDSAGHEFYTLARGERGADGLEDDLFAGLVG